MAWGVGYRGVWQCFALCGRNRDNEGVSLMRVLPAGRGKVQGSCLRAIRFMRPGPVPAFPEFRKRVLIPHVQYAQDPLHADR